MMQGDLAGALERISRKPRHRASPCCQRPGKRGIAARSRDWAEQDRASAAGAKRSCQSARHIPPASRPRGAAAAAKDPANTKWQRDLAIALTFVGNVLTDQSDFAGAQAAYQESVDVARALAATDPGK